MNDDLFSLPVRVREETRVRQATRLLGVLSVGLIAAGCGGGGGGGTSTTASPTPSASPSAKPSATPTPTPTPTPSPSATPISPSAFANKGFTTSAIPFAPGQTATLFVAVAGDGVTIAATLNLAIAAASAEHRLVSRPGSGSGATAIAIPLNGTISLTNGTFTIAGNVNRGGSPYTITGTGSLPNVAAGGTANHVALNLNGVQAASSFVSNANLYGTVDSSFFPLTGSLNPQYELDHADNGGAPTTTALFGTLFPISLLLSGSGFLEGGTTQTSLNGITVNKITERDTTGATVGYLYYNASASSLVDYGEDTLTATGAPLYGYRPSPSFSLPFNLAVGQTHTETVPVAITNGTTSYPYAVSVTEKVTFNDIETIAAPMGTYTAAKYTTSYVTTFAGANGPSSEVDVAAATFYLVSGLGVVEEHLYSADTRSGSTSYATDDYVLTSNGAITNGETRGASVSRFSAAKVMGIPAGN